MAETEDVQTCLTLRLFGPFTARVEGQPLMRLRSCKGQWLLALLILRQDCDVDRAWLAGSLWPESAESQARDYLRHSLTNLRRALGSQAYRLGAPTPHTLRLDLSGAVVDVIAFDEITATAFTDRAALERAVALYRGPLMEGCAEEWVLQEREKRELAYLSALEALSAQAIARGEPGVAVSCLRRIVAADPLRETAQRALMQVLAAEGDYSAAVLVYRDLRLLLHRQLHSEPDPETTALWQQIRNEARRRAVARVAAPIPNRASPLRRSHPLTTLLAGTVPFPFTDIEGSARLWEEQPYPLYPNQIADFLPLRSLKDYIPPNNLPIQTSSFIGREMEMAGVKTLLSRTHLLTLTGSGGCGKTRLSLQMAADVLGEYPDGVWLVELASLSDTALVVQTVANTLGVREAPGQSLLQTLTAVLKSRHLLLVLDNCEHLLAACAQLADACLHACPDVKILATSREGLNIPGESLYRVPSLSLPDTERTPTPESLRQSEATRLFIERAMAVRSDFAVNVANAPILAAVCQYLDGIPLAIELAAARVRALSLEQLASHLKDCIRILTGGSRTALPRQQTLRAAIDWSYNLLHEQERLLLNRLSVFAGGWTLEAAEFVCGADESIGCRAPGVFTDGSEGTESPRYPTPDPRYSHATLDLLTSLVDKSLVTYDESSAGGRYRLLETVKQYGSEHLHASGELAAVRRRHLDFYLRLAEQAEPKLSEPEQGAWSNRLNLELHNLRAAWEWSSEAQETEAGLRLTGALGRFWWVMNFYVEGSVWQERVLRNPQGLSAPLRAKALTAAALLAHHRANQEEAASLVEESLALYRQLGDSQGIAFALAILGWVATFQGDLDRAAGCFADSLSLAREAQDSWLIAYTLIGSGVEAAIQRGHADAVVVLEEALTCCREAGDPYLVNYALLNLGLQRYYTNDISQARTLFEETIRLSLPARHQRRIAGSLEGFAYLAVSQKQHERGAFLLGAAEVLREITGAPLLPQWEAAHDLIVATTRDTLGAEQFAVAWAGGRSLRMEQAVVLALAPVPPAECSEGPVSV